jgi:hypothetical protein
MGRLAGGRRGRRGGGSRHKSGSQDGDQHESRASPMILRPRGEPWSIHHHGRESRIRRRIEQAAGVLDQPRPSRRRVDAQHRAGAHLGGRHRPAVSFSAAPEVVVALAVREALAAALGGAAGRHPSDPPRPASGLPRAEERATTGSREKTPPAVGVTGARLHLRSPGPFPSRMQQRTREPASLTAPSPPVKGRHVTVRVPTIPAARWPGTVQ